MLPQFVEGELGGDTLRVGIAVGAFAVGAVLLRPYAGRLGDRYGRRMLVIIGAFVVAVSAALYPSRRTSGSWSWSASSVGWARPRSSSVRAR